MELSILLKYKGEAMELLTNITENIFSNLEAPIVFLIVAIALRIANIILGSIDAMFKKDFEWDKFFSGVLKMIVVAITILIVIVILNLFTYGLTLIKVTIPKETVSAMTVILIIVTWCVDLSMEVAEKIKSMKQLKYISYDDVSFQQNANPDGGIG